MGLALPHMAICGMACPVSTLENYVSQKTSQLVSLCLTFLVCTLNCTTWTCMDAPIPVVEVLAGCSSVEKQGSSGPLCVLWPSQASLSEASLPESP
jgi:hypothetical protein